MKTSFSLSFGLPIVRAAKADEILHEISFNAHNTGNLKDGINETNSKYTKVENIDKYKNEYLISTDVNKLDIKVIYDFLTNESGWSDGIPFEKVEKSINNSLNFGIYNGQKLIGYARVISDFSTIAYLGDVFILKEFRGLGLSKWLMETIIEHKELQDLRRWILLTSTAEWLYEKYGFTKLPKPEIYMEKYNPNVYA